MRSGRPRGPGKALKNVGAKPPTFWKAFPGPRGRPNLKNASPKIRPDCLQVPGLLYLQMHQNLGRKKKKNKADRGREPNPIGGNPKVWGPIPRPGQAYYKVFRWYSVLRNNASWLVIGLPGRILAGLLPGNHRNGPSGRPKAGDRADVGVFPVAVRPKSGPEGRFTARKHDCVT